MMAEDYYKTLGVRRDASQEEIQAAYRELARKYHPDLNPDDKTAKKRFQEVQAAFDVLGNSEKREMYDRYGSSFETMGAGGAGGPGGGPYWQANRGPAGGGGFSFEDVDLSQFFGERFGEEPAGGFADLFSQFRRQAPGTTRGGTRGARRGQDFQEEITIPFQTAVTGGEIDVALQREPGQFETIRVKIPAGIEDGKKIRLRGQGGKPPRAGRAGDLLLVVRVASHPHFTRRGNHLHVRVPVTLAEAAAGAKVDVPTPGGTVSLRVPVGTSSGTKLRIKGHGVVGKDGTRGDLIAEIQVMLPPHLDDESLEMIRKIDARHPSSPRAELRW